MLLWAPFLLKQSNWFGLQIPNASMLAVYANYDGPLYIVPAKTFYNPELITKLQTGLQLTPQYYAAHLPLYPVLISSLSPVLGYLKSMLVVTIVSTVLLAVFFYYLLTQFRLTSKPLLLVTIFLFLPRFLVVRSVGAPEAVFMLLILLSLYFFETKQFLFSGIAGALAVATKTPGILLAVAYGFVFIESYIVTKKLKWEMFVAPVLTTLGLVAVFLLYAVQYGDFFAFFHTGGVVPLVFPYSVFNFQQKWIGTAWLEDIIFYFFLYAVTCYSLRRSKYRSFFYFAITFFVATTFVQHRDIARYSLPLWPMACIALEKVITDRRLLWGGVAVLPAIYLYGWNFIAYNVLPVLNWAPFQ